MRCGKRQRRPEAAGVYPSLNGRRRLIGPSGNRAGKERQDDKDDFAHQFDTVMATVWPEVEAIADIAVPAGGTMPFQSSPAPA